MSAAVTVIATGTANLASVIAAFRRLGVATVLTDRPEQVRRAARIVLPGVGAYGAAMASLRAQELDLALRERVDGGTPLLAICLGLQLLAAASEESPRVAGLGALSGVARRLRGDVPIPQLGWNRIVAGPTSRLVHDGYAYYANSYVLTDAPGGWTASYSAHGETFVAALERDAQLACQFHPELSGAWGARLLARWLAC